MKCFWSVRKNIDMSSRNRIWTRENSRLSINFKWVRNFQFWNLTRKHDPIYRIRCLSNCGVGPLPQVTNGIYEMRKFYIFLCVVRRLTWGNMKQHKKVQFSHHSNWQITISNIQFDSRNWVFFKICWLWRNAQARTCIAIKLELISAGRKASEQVNKA